MNRPLQIGVTGGIGSGKSVVCRVFAALGAPVALAFPDYPGSLPLNEVLAFIRKAPTDAE